MEDLILAEQHTVSVTASAAAKMENYGEATTNVTHNDTSPPRLEPGGVEEKICRSLAVLHALNIGDIPRILSRLIFDGSSNSFNKQVSYRLTKRAFDVSLNLRASSLLPCRAYCRHCRRPCPECKLGGVHETPRVAFQRDNLLRLLGRNRYEDTAHPSLDHR